MASPKVTIRPARSSSDLAAISKLFTAYAASLGIDLTFQDFSSELAGIPGKYAPERGGELLLATRPAREDGKEREVIGCIALRALPGASSSELQPTAELKRLYTTPSARGLGAGRALIQAALEAARTLGYERVKLDTLPSMHAAISLYESMGFKDVERYYETPLEGTRFLGRDL